MKNTPIKIALVDDQILFLKGLRLILSNFPRFKVVLEAGNGQELLNRLPDTAVDIILLDVEMPLLDGTQTLEQLTTHHPGISVIMLTMHDNDRLISQLMEAGAAGFLLKDEDPAIVREAIEHVYDKGLYFRDYVSKALLRNNRKKTKALQRPPASRAVNFSEREIEVLLLICQELTSKEIAERLFISVRTVDGHRRKLQEKTGSRNSVGLVRYAMRHDMI
ncbi:MAG: response regulator transcription factor [Saprospiraceae bacterium]